jgi:hypothetical protein
MSFTKEAAMKRCGPNALRALMLFGVAVFTSTSAAVEAQESLLEAPASSARTVSEKIDEYGDLRWCDLSARLDNLAIKLQNEPGLTGFVVGYDSVKGRVRPAGRRFKIVRYYLVEQRGIAAERLVFVAAGTKPDGEELTELWVVPEGAVPPVSPAPVEDADERFSGKLDSYLTDDSFYGFVSELGPSETDIEFSDFAEKLKAHPDSKGYLVIRAAKRSVPGAWRRIARRDEDTLRKNYHVEAGRLQSIDGGYSDGEDAVVELWILPKDAPAPAGLSEKLESRPVEAFELDSLTYDGQPDEDQERWSLDSLVAQLKDDPQARAVIIIRPFEPQPPSLESEEGGGAPSQSDAKASAEVEAEAAEAEGDENSVVNPQTLAERWRQTLVEKYGIEFHRIHVMFGRPQHYVGAQLLTWVVPRAAPLPDPLAVTQDVEQVPEEQPDEEGDSPQRQ